MLLRRTKGVIISPVGVDTSFVIFVGRIGIKIRVEGWAHQSPHPHPNHAVTISSYLRMLHLMLRLDPKNLPDPPLGSARPLRRPHPLPPIHPDDRPDLPLRRPMRIHGEPDGIRQRLLYGLAGAVHALSVSGWDTGVSGESVWGDL